MGARNSVSSCSVASSPARKRSNVSGSSAKSAEPSLALQRQVDVARVALALVELRHEADRHPLLVGDLLGAVLEDAVLVGRAQDVGVAEVDLVLAEVALALGVLHDQAGGAHLVADAADRAAPRARCPGASSRRCRGWPARGRGSRGGRPRRRACGRSRNSSSVAPTAVQPRSRRRSSCRRRIWRGEATTGLPSPHCRSTRHIAVAGCQGTGRSVDEVRLHLEVPVAALPGGHRVARRRCSCRRRRPAGSCSASAPWAATSSRKWRAVRRLPCNRPCMSVSATRTVSTAPSRTWASSSSRVMAREGTVGAPLRQATGCPTWIASPCWSPTPSAPPRASRSS